jgi:hypothetical protein
MSNIQSSQTFKPLYLRASLNGPPKHQQMDTSTLEWLKSQSRYKIDTRCPEDSKLSEDQLQLLTKLIPHKKTFYSRRKYFSIHGISHILRVMVNTLMVCNMIKYKKETPLLIAASIHDLRRKDDRTDIGHGKRSWKWYQLNKNEFNWNLKSDNNIVRIATTYHNIDYPKIPSHVLKKYKTEIDIIKAADALDRYRLPTKKGWPKLKFIMLPEAHNLLEICKKFTIETEEDILTGKGAKKSILEFVQTHLYK